MFRSGVQFIGRYVGLSTENIQWSSPDHCTQTTVTNAIETFVCSNSGEVLIELSQGAETLNFKLVPLNIHHLRIILLIHFNIFLIVIWYRGSF